MTRLFILASVWLAAHLALAGSPNIVLVVPPEVTKSCNPNRWPFAKYDEVKLTVGIEGVPR